jgi:hypothetical protein
MEFYMKTEEDEAFDDLARKQGSWGGGFPAKRRMAAHKLEGDVDAFERWWYYEGSAPPQRGEDHEEHTKRMCKIAWSNGAYVTAQPAQEPVECLDCGSHNVGIPATYDSLVNSVKALNT